MPKISVIVPVYNVQEYLAKCIDSVLAQTFSDYEIIVVDDGSTDNSGVIAAQYAARHPCIRVITQENGGLGAARNTGIEAAQGEYLLLVDSDDTIAPEALQVLMDTTICTDADLVIFDLLLINLQGIPTQRETGCKYFKSGNNVLENHKLLLDWPSACNKLWRRELFLSSGIRYPGRVWYEDLRTTPKLLTLANRVAYVPQPFYHYLQRPGSIMHSSAVARNQEILDAFDDLLAYFKEHRLFDTYYAELEFLAVYHILITASVRVLKADRKHPLLRQFGDYVQQRFPQYMQNRYLAERLSGRERTVLKLISRQQYGLLTCLFKLKNRV